jgi:predicted alpha/beta hydrolase family esterase
MTRVLLLPGWQNSGPGHWQTLWERLHGWQRVEQDDWFWPRRGDWMARLDDVMLSTDEPTLLAAHSLGCHLVTAWAAHSRHTARAVGALLVAPPDLERRDLPPQIACWQPPAARRLPFPSTLVSSSDDPYCAVSRASAMALDWGSTLVMAGPRGHMNADSGLSDWPEGRGLLLALAPT